MARCFSFMLCITESVLGIKAYLIIILHTIDGPCHECKMVGVVENDYIKISQILRQRERVDVRVYPELHEQIFHSESNLYQV